MSSPEALGGLGRKMNKDSIRGKSCRLPGAGLGVLDQDEDERRGSPIFGEVGNGVPIGLAESSVIYNNPCKAGQGTSHQHVVTDCLFSRLSGESGIYKTWETVCGNPQLWLRGGRLRSESRVSDVATWGWLRSEKLESRMRGFTHPVAVE
ncbi:uncharacterized protein BDR25DRAFT_383377 [Lindgomyces ingoldianus]|uniref:Uncharacterized protein n=1 Tax=Lindgomyces ingoldianus TaxID=673940 RepID=A0ACB6Q9Y3_9PLEO|nr:uncharacterized protein BDR25DRAFT_383377 [Lindgomyces ingoldianus]KAF2463759.1 hypothetical protein BDR25DRAFT_383377 [Lindgomyces ingoldianus]